MSEPAMQRRGLGDVIPVPADVRPDPAGDFTLGTGTAIRTAPGSAEAARIGEYLAALLRPATGYPLPVGPESGEIALLLDDDADGETDGDEGYRLDIGASGVTVRAAAPAGLFAAVQTLRQLLPIRSLLLPLRPNLPCGG